MRWRKPRTLDERIVKRFLFLPYTLKSGKMQETRWLEFANILQVYCGEFWANIEYIN